MNTALPPIVLQSIKVEYQTTGISKEEILKKYGYTEDQLPFNEWDYTTTSYVEATETSQEPKLVTEVVVSEAPSLPALPSDDEQDNTEANELRDSINKTAKSIISKVNSLLIESYGEDVSPKDIKDLASTLLSLKEATVGKDPTVSIVVDNSTNIQNNTLMQIVETIKSAKRDC
jgi:hypothetical protein